MIKAAVLADDQQHVLDRRLGAAVAGRLCRYVREYHSEFAKRHRDKITQPVPLDVIGAGPRRPWNGHWTAYDLLMAEPNLVGKRVMVPGCGFGDDAIRLAKLGTEVHAFDLSP